MGELGLVILVGVIVGVILILRLLGAWMLRINEVIRELKEIKTIIKNK